MKSSYTSTKVDRVSKCLRNPISRLFVKFIFFKLFFMKFEKVLESRIIFEYLNPNPNEKICDIACGCGEYFIKLSNKGCDLVGCDFDQKSIEIARTLSGKEAFVVTNAEKLPFVSNTFDKVVSACALEHFKYDEAAICEMYRILKPGGILVLTVDSFTYEISKDLLNKHRVNNYVTNYYSFPQLKNKLEKYGFAVKNAKYFVNSPLSVLFFLLSTRNVCIGMAIFPFVLGITMLSDSLVGANDKGIFLAIKAKKK